MYLNTDFLTMILRYTNGDLNHGLTMIPQTDPDSDFSYTVTLIILTLIIEFVTVIFSLSLTMIILTMIPPFLTVILSICSQWFIVQFWTVIFKILTVILYTPWRWFF